MAKKQAVDYQALKTELDGIMQALQQEDLDVDQALKHYERGLLLVKTLENYLKTAENQVQELKAKFSGSLETSEK
jgi:exodeoxyribonuclease VII small subunit